MLNETKCNSSKSVSDIVLGIEIDRILIFVGTKVEIETFRQSNFYYLEVINRNIEQGTVSNIFFLKNLALELIWIENRELALRYSLQTDINIVARTQWQQNHAIPFGFVLRYVSSQQQLSRRRRHNVKNNNANKGDTPMQIGFSRENLRALKEPACYLVPESLTCESLLDNTSAIEQKLLWHQSRIARLTNIQVTLNNSEPQSNTISLLSTLNLIEIERGDYPKLNLEFENGRRRQLLSQFSTIPLTISY